MMELMVSRQTCVDEGESAHTFEYFLLQDRLCAGGVDCEDYGVMVRSFDGEQARIPHITTDHERITQLLHLLYSNNVSPVHLHDIIEDWL